MRNLSTLKWASLAAISAAAFAAATPASAGRCGGSLAVDAPTTFARVARACNVSVGALREANPGVNSGNVRPGEHLAIPDEIIPGAGGSYAPVAAVDTDVSSTVSSHPYLASPGYHSSVADDYGMNYSAPVQDYRGDGARSAQRIRIRDARVSSTAPSWLRPEAQRGGHYSASSRLSYQKFAALRIKNAGFQLASATGVDAQGVLLPKFTDKIPTTHGYRLPDYDKIGILPAQGHNVHQATFALSGNVIDAADGCLVLKTDNDMFWRLAASPPSGELLGKHITVWGVAIKGGACGDGPSMLVSHAVYAEPWAGN